MAYVKIQDGQVQKFPYTIGDLRKDNPRTSFPRRIPDTSLASYGVFEVQVDAAPAVDEKSYKAVRDETPVYTNGAWRLQWSTVEKTLEEKQRFEEAAQGRVRAKRDDLIAATDYFALTDVTMDAAMTTYRQALRDITDHVNFPYLGEDDWPVKL